MGPIRLPFSGLNFHPYTLLTVTATGNTAQRDLYVSIVFSSGGRGGYVKLLLRNSAASGAHDIPFFADQDNGEQSKCIVVSLDGNVGHDVRVDTIRNNARGEFLISTSP